LGDNRLEETRNHPTPETQEDQTMEDLTIRKTQHCQSSKQETPGQQEPFPRYSMEVETKQMTSSKK